MIQDSADPVSSKWHQRRGLDLKRNPTNSLLISHLCEAIGSPTPIRGDTPSSNLTGSGYIKIRSSTVKRDRSHTTTSKRLSRSSFASSDKDSWRLRRLKRGPEACWLRAIAYLQKLKRSSRSWTRQRNNLVLIWLRISAMRITRTALKSEGPGYLLNLYSKLVKNALTPV